MDLTPGRIYFQWRYVALPPGDPWKRRPGQVLRYEMTEDEAIRHMAAHPGEIIEPIPGSGTQRYDNDRR